MSGVRGVIRRFGMPDAISWPAFWVTYFSAVVGTYIINSGPVPLVTRLGVLFVASIPMWSLLLLVRRIFFRDPERSRPVVMLIALTAGVILRAACVAWLFSHFVGLDEAKLGIRLLGAPINVGLAYVLTANVVVAIRERRRQIAQLQSQRRRLDSAIEGVSYGINEQNEQTIERVRTVLVKELSALEDSSPVESLNLLQSTASEVVRPMSHELAHAVPRVEVRVTEADSTPVVWPEVINQAASGRPFSPWVVGLVIAIELLTVILNDPSGVLVYFGLAGILIVLLAIANRCLGGLLPGKSMATRIALVIAFALIVSLLIGALQVVLQGSSRLNLAIAGALAFFVFVFTLGTAVVTALGRDRDRVIEELRESSRQLEHGLVRLRQVQWFQQKALSRALHGPIQMAVTAAAIKLDAAIQKGPVQAGLVDSVRSELLAGLDVLHEADFEVTTLDRAIERMRATFDGVCEVEASVSDDAAAVLAADGVLRSCVIDIVTEAVSNAFRHGNASRVIITMLSDADTVAIDVEDNGQPNSNESGAGLGSTLLDECTLSWSLTDTASGHVLHAVLPAVPAPASQWA